MDSKIISYVKNKNSLYKILKCCCLIKELSIPLELITGYVVGKIDILEYMSQNINMILAECFEEHSNYEKDKNGLYCNAIYEIDITLELFNIVSELVHDELESYVRRVSKILELHFEYRIWYDLQTKFDRNCKIIFISTIMTKEKWNRILEIKNKNNQRKRQRDNSPEINIRFNNIRLN